MVLLSVSLSNLSYCRMTFIVYYTLSYFSTEKQKRRFELRPRVYKGRTSFNPSQSGVSTHDQSRRICRLLFLQPRFRKIKSKTGRKKTLKVVKFNEGFRSQLKSIWNNRNIAFEPRMIECVKKFEDLVFFINEFKWKTKIMFHLKNNIGLKFEQPYKFMRKKKR